MIEISGLTKKYLTKTALQDVTLKIEDGGITGLIGENGSGKSTLLKIIAGLVRPTSGDVTVNGKEVSRTIATDVAYLSELDAYYPFFTVQQMIDFEASQFPDFDKERAQAMISFMKINPSSKMKTLSKGNRGRVKIVLTLSRNAPIILMDEPLSGLDPMVRESIVESLISFIDVEKQTVIITTHEINEMEPLFDRVIAIKNGRILATADTETIRHEQNLRLVDWLKKEYR